jgi:hypothetical protein
VFLRGKRAVTAGVAIYMVSAIALASCGGNSTTARLVIRGADDVQVMTPEEVVAAKAATGEVSTGADASGTTIPLNEDNRPAEVKLFSAYQKFTDCLTADGYKIEGNLQDPNNPKLKDPDYVASLTKCAARSDILGALRASQEAQAKLTPEEVQKRNENFKKISDCLKKRGWTIETSVADNGVIQPKVFTSAEGGINDRDIEQCITETGINSE